MNRRSFLAARAVREPLSSLLKKEPGDISAEEIMELARALQQLIVWES